MTRVAETPADPGLPVNPNARAGWWAVAVFLVLYVFSSIDRSIINLLVHPIQEHLAIGDLQMSLLMGPAFGVFYALAAVPLGWAADRYSRRKIVFAGIMVWALAACACGLAHTFGQLFVARMCVGVGEAALLPSAYAIISGSFSRDRLTVPLSVLSMGSVAGGAIGLLLGGWITDLVSQYPPIQFLPGWMIEPWQVMFIVTALPCFGLAFLVFTVPDAARSPLSEAARGRILPLLRRNWRILLGIGGGYGVMAIVGGAVLAWAPTYIVRSFDWSAGRAGVAMGALLLIFSTIGKLGSGFIVDAMFRRGIRDAHLRYYVMAIVLSSPPALVAFLTPQPLVFLALLAPFFLLTFPCMGYASALVQLITPPELRSQMSSLFLMVMNLIALGLGALTVGWLSEVVFGGKAHLDSALITIIVVAAPLALVATLQALPPTRLRLAEG